MKSRAEKQSQKKVESVERRYSRAKCCVLPMICVSGGSKSGLAKAAGAEVAVQRRHEKRHAAVARSAFSCIF